MSSLTICNYCSLKRIRAHAKDAGQKVTIIRASFHTWTQGQDVYVHPPEVDFDKLTHKERQQYHRSWFAELTEECCC